jgi:ABC-type uncharacterized transport system ATPase subunit
MASPVGVKELSKHFHKQTVLHQLSFQVAEGETLDFLGSNGARPLHGVGCSKRLFFGLTRKIPV